MNLSFPEILMVVGLLIVLALVGYLVWQSKQSAAAPSALSVMRSHLASLENSVASLASAAGTFSVKIPVASTPAAPAPAATLTAPVAWSLDDSYSSLGALAADIARPDFTRQVRIDGAPVFNIGGANPVDFYSVGEALTQTKPAV